MLTFFVVQCTKTFIEHWIVLPTDLYAVLVAFLILSFAQIALGSSPMDWRMYGLSFANLIAAADGQMQRKSIDPHTVVKEMI